MKRPLIISGSLALFIASISVILAAFDVPWQTLDGGGGVSTATIGTSTWTIRGTVGQAEAHVGTSTNASGFSLSGGYWAIAVPSEGPRLNIAKSGSNAVVSWGADAVGYQLQLSPDLQGWSPFGTVISAAGQITVTPVPGTPKLFFRLKLP